MGQDFLSLYAHASSSCLSEQILHLCFIDRLAFVLQSAYQDAFIKDVQTTTLSQTPLIYLRSEAAWQTHPRNYQDLEQSLFRTGELLFDQTLDLAWCQVAVTAQDLQSIIPLIKRSDISMMAEVVLALRHQIQTKTVDWLAWEDPFIYQRDPQQLKAEREQSLAETHKRLGYVIPMLQLLQAASKIRA